MRVDRQARSRWGLWISLFISFTILPSCAVYTVNKAELETQLRSKEARQLDLSKLYRKAFRNHIDTLTCKSQEGMVILKKIDYDSKIIVVTKSRGAIRYYAKSLYIYKGEFLIGERTAPRLYGPNYFPVRLSDIERIEVNGSWF